MIIRANKEFDTLYEFLDHYKDDIEYVKLTWTWPNIYVIESNRYLMVWDGKDKEYYPRQLDLGFSVEEIDEEYTFWGPIEDALEFSQNYDCWDGRIGNNPCIEDGVFECDYKGDNFEEYYHPDEFDPNGKYTMVLSLGYMTWGDDGDNWHTVTHGPVVKGHYELTSPLTSQFVIDRILDDEPGLSTWESHLCKKCKKYEICKKMDPLKTPPIKVMDAGEGRYLYDPVCPVRDLIGVR